jgi:uncharacterized membrane protein YoaK (UPF0700 family)
VQRLRTYATRKPKCRHFTIWNVSRRPSPTMENERKRAPWRRTMRTAAAAPAALAIAFFVGGSFAGALLADAAGRRARQLVFGVVAASLALIVGLTELGLSFGGVHIATISFAMGLMNSALAQVGALSVSLTFVTGTLSKLGVHLAKAVRHAPLRDSQGSWDTHLHRALLLAGIWGAFLAGAVLAGAATPRFGVWVLLFPTLILSALAALDLTLSAAVDRRKKAIADQGC